jgi:hypothetical protein
MINSANLYDDLDVATSVYMPESKYIQKKLVSLLQGSARWFQDHEKVILQIPSR